MLPCTLLLLALGPGPTRAQPASLGDPDGGPAAPSDPPSDHPTEPHTAAQDTPPTLPFEDGQARSAQRTAMARALFTEGVQLADAGEWAEAKDRFARALALRPSSGIAYNLACAEIETGQLVLASERLRQLLQDPGASSALKRDAARKLERLLPRLAALTVHVSDPSPTLEVRIDDRPLPRAVWDVASPSDPGIHTLTLHDGDALLSTVRVTLSEGERREQVLFVPEPEPSPLAREPAAPLAVQSAPRDDTTRGLAKNPWLWVGIGSAAAVTAGVVAAIVLRPEPDDREAAPVMGNAGPGVIRW